MEYTHERIYQSNYWYNDGLKKAQARDLSGAAESLKNSLKLDRENIAARNLLGLVYYGRGEVTEALVEWILSKNLAPQDNIADYYLHTIQQSPTEFGAVDQAVKKYNQSLIYCQQGGEDLAIIQLKQAVTLFPGFLRAHQLLALLYLHTEQYGKARQELKEAYHLDKGSSITVRYMQALKSSRKTTRSGAGKKSGEKAQTVTYHVGNDTVIQPVSAMLKENNSRMTMLCILAGMAIGIAVMWFLVVPAKTRSVSQKTNQQVIEFSDRIAEQEAQISALKTELESYRASSEESENAQQTAESTQDSYEIVIEIYGHYTASDMSDAAMVEQLVKVNPDALGTLGKDRYEEMTETLYARYGKSLYGAALNAYNVAEYGKAIDDLEILMTFDEGYENGKAVYLLYRAYEADEDEENAAIWKEKAEEDYPGADTSDVAVSDTETTEE